MRARFFGPKKQTRNRKSRPLYKTGGAHVGVYIHPGSNYGTFSALNSDGLFTTALSNSLSSLEKSHSCRFRIIKGEFYFNIEHGILNVLIRIASLSRF